MQTTFSTLRQRAAQFLRLGSALILSSLIIVPASQAADSPKAQGEMVPLTLDLPASAFKGTPKDLQLSSYVEPLSEKPRPPMMVPAGLKNIASQAKLSSSVKTTSEESLAKVTDGKKDAVDENVLSLRKGTQWVQLNFDSPQSLYAVVIWHAHNTAKVYRDVIVQLADDPDFGENVRTIFNNDQDNSSGLGVGTDREFLETHEGKLLDLKGDKARCIRFYSKGSTEGALNEYTEVEVYGRPAK